MASRNNIFTTIRTEGALLPADLLGRISEGASIEGLTPESYHLYPGEKLNEVVNQRWNRLQGAWAAFRSGQERLSENDLGTTLTRERWLLPLFDALGYGRLQTATSVEIDGRSYPISHGWQQVPVHLVSYKLELDRRTPGAAGAASASPHSLLQVFLNRSDDHLWGFLSNGYKLRLLRDNVSLTRQAYVEFDLEAMLEGEVYSDFVLLWLLCHQSRVEGEKPAECWLERWMKVAQDQGTRALEQLRSGTEAAITALGNGYLERPDNAGLRAKLTDGDLSGQDYYRQLLRIVYRLLFLFVAEDRELLYDPSAPEASREIYHKYYSTQRLRHMAETFKGTNHPDLFEGLRLVMRLLGGEASSLDAGALLGLPTLGSFLFSDEAVPDVIDCKISNQRLLEAIRALSLTYDARTQVYRSIDYRNLGPEELGSVYESLLEQHPQINVPARRFALDTASGNERKTTGSYYTPTSLINALLDSALDPVLNEALYGEEGTRRASLPEAEERIRALKICDPACGSGHFLIAAAQRMAKALAFVRTGEEEPPPAAVQEAKRDIIGRCIYGVDINPMAVELCKVNLWMEALEPGKPLSFLESHIQCGNSLLGTTPRLMTGGIPDDAFSPIEGDDKAEASRLKKINRTERRDRETGQMSMFGLVEPPADYAALTRAAAALNTMEDETLADVRRKEAAYAALATSSETRKAEVLADAWCAAFVWEKGAATGLIPLTDLTYRRLEDTLRGLGDDGTLPDDLIAVINEVARLQQRYQFFHWHVAFPDVFAVPEEADTENEAAGWDGGFDCVLGNPPWERIKIQEKEWFAQRVPDIANAPNAAARKRMIDDLITSDPYVYADFQADLRKAEGESHYVRGSERYPLTGRGDVNTYAIFAENNRSILTETGYAGFIIQSDIATADTNKFFFEQLLKKHQLVSFYDFVNTEGLFPAIHRTHPHFCLITISGEPKSKPADFAFWNTNADHLDETNRHFTLTIEDVTLLNPNSKTVAIFRGGRDAEITKAIFRRCPVLLQDDPLNNPWAIYYIRLVHMTDHGMYFRSAWETPDIDWNMPLYEAKFFLSYDHRYGSFPDQESEAVYEVSISQKKDPYFSVHPRYVLPRDFVDTLYDKYPEYDKGWILVWREITNTTNERTLISTALPKGAASLRCPVIGFQTSYPSQCLLVNLNSFAIDYVTRQKQGGTALAYFVLKQLPVIPPHTYTPALIDFIVPRVLELSYTAWDLQPFAQDVGYDGAPFVWDEDRRFVMRCELDALYFHLYQISREDVDYILETFPIVKRKDEAAHGEYRTKDTIMSMYDEMAVLPTMAVPAPKDESAAYGVPDVAQWQPWLNPPPGDRRAAHQAEKGSNV